MKLRLVQVKMMKNHAGELRDLGIGRISIRQYRQFDPGDQISGVP